ncbi:MAG: BrnT family toxin [Acidobacteriota bacterium]|nr:BrnT family toxin [Acidobacteriota bacterium]
MKFEWDENKRLINLKMHSIDFIDVQKIFDNEVYAVIDDRFDYEEIRFFTLGLLNGRVIAVAHTETDNVIRIISARKANKYDQKKYFKKIRN